MSLASLKNWKDFPDGREKYHLYLASREWALLKEAVRARSRGVCERCRNSPTENVHHKTYERIYMEQPEDLIHVCRPCHEFLSGKNDYDPMPTRINLSTVGCSDHSLFKQDMFRNFMVMHSSICKEIAAKHRWGQWEYLYIDLFAGPGYLPNKVEVAGSPVVAFNALQGKVPFRMIAFEEDPVVASLLSERVSGVSIHHGRYQDIMIPALSSLQARKRCGLVYGDPNELSPKDTSLIDACAALKKLPVTSFLDILLHIPATTFKRVRGTNRYRDAPHLTDELKRIGKRFIKVSRPDDRHQWTFILLTNFDHPKFGLSMGWHDSNSDRGRFILDKITLTARERSDLRPSGFLFDNG